MDPEGPRLISPFRAPTVAERKKWLFMAQEKQPAPHRGEDLTSQRPSLNKLRLSTAAKVRITPRFFRRSKKMNKKPPVPEKSERIKNLPVPRPRNVAPPPKPLPYNVHRSEMAKKPDPVPRKVSRQGNGIPSGVTNHQTTTGSSETTNSGVEETSPPRPTHPRAKLPKPSPPRLYSGGVTSRPRLETPVTPLDPDVVPQNGVLSPSVSVGRGGTAAAPAPTRSRHSLSENKKSSVAVNGRGKMPLPPVPKNLNSTRGGGGGEASVPVYSEALGDVSVSEKPVDEELYSTISDPPSRARTPTPSQTPPIPLSGSMTPPVPPPRPSHASSPVQPLVSSEYSVTSHTVGETKSSSPLAVLNPTPPDTYSMLARPDQPNKPLNPVPSGDVGQMYSSLELDGIQQLAPPPKPAYMDEGYSHLEFDGTAATNLQTVAEHYEVNTSPVGTEGSVRRATNPARMGIYEEVSPQDENVSNCISENKHRPLSNTQSAPLLEEKKSQTVPRAKPKVVPRQLSDKNIELRDQTSEHAEEVVNDVTGKVVGAVKLAPAPAPRSWKKSKTLEICTGIIRQGDEGRCAYFGDSQDPSMEDEDFYTIVPDGENENTPEPSPSIQEMMEAVEAIPLESVPFDTSGHENWGEQVVPEISHSQTQQPQAPTDESMVQQATVEDGRESSSSFLRECLSEFDKIKSNELPSNSPTHVMVNIDEISQQINKDKTEGCNEEEMTRQGDTDEEKSCRHSYENQVIVDQNKEGNKEWGTVVEKYDMNTVNPTEESAQNSQGAVDEDLSQYSLQTVKKPDIELDAQGYCKVEVSTNKDQSLSLVEDVLSHFESTTLSDLPPLSQDDDIINYDMKTVEHPPVPTNAQGYSYCGIDMRSPSELTAGDAGFGTSQNNSGNSAAAEPPPPPLPSGYSEIDVSRSGVIERPAEQQEYAAIEHRPPKTTPKPSRRKGEASKPPSNAEISVGTPKVEEGLPQATAEEEDTKTELSDTDSLYARVLDITKQPEKKVSSSPKPSPKPKRKKQVTGGVGKPKAKRKGQTSPRRRPPPPPPPGTRIPGSAPLPPSTFTVPPTLPLSAPCPKMSPQEGEHRFEQTLPPFPSYQPTNQGSPSHQPAAALADSLTSSLPPLPPLLGSPKLPGRKGPLPPSPTAGSPQTVDPPSPIHRRGLFNRIKSSSLKSRKPENNSPTTVSPLLTDEVGRVGGDQSPKVGWKNKFRFRRGSGNSAASMDTAVPGEEYVGEAACATGGGAGLGESRRRRNQEDKLPEVPPTAKSRSLPAPARQLGEGIHLHPYEGEEEEMEDDLYSVVNKPAKTVQQPAAAIKAEATGGEKHADASKAYEVVIPPSLLRARTGSRGKNDVMRKSSSVEHLMEQEDAPNLNEAVEQGDRVVELGAHSATSSPVLPRRRPRHDQAEGDPPDLDRRGFHLGTLPRSRKPPVAPPPKTRHVYATVSKSEEAAAAAGSKGSPPSTLPKPKRGREGVASENGSALETNSRPEGALANFDIPMLEVLEPLDAAVSLSHVMDGGSMNDAFMPDANAVDKACDEDLQGLPSSEIPHERAEDGHIYAVVDKKSKKKKKKRLEPVERTEDNHDDAQESSPFTLEVGVEDGVQPKSPTKKPPVKPPRMKPPKPAPYMPRVGSPIPAILAAAAAECSSSPLPPLSPKNISPPAIPDRLPTKTFEEPRSLLPALSPRTASPGDAGLTVPPDVKQQFVRLSLVGPPSFPPPPPPQDASSPPPLGHTYEAPPTLMNSRSTEATGTPKVEKAPAKPPPHSAVFTIDDVEDEVTPGYEIVTRVKNRAKSANKGSRVDAPVKKSPPTKQKSLPEDITAGLKPPLPPPVLYKDEKAKSPAPSAVIARSPHLYEAVSEEVIESNRLTVEAESSRPSSTVSVPRCSHTYETLDDVKNSKRPRPTKGRPSTAKKRLPPPAPPTSAAKQDSGSPNVTAEMTNGAADSPNGGVRRSALNSSSSIASPVAEIVSNPMSYLGANMAGKRLLVDIQYDADEEEERETNEPKFLFNKGRSSHFIPVGQDKPEAVALSPGHSSTTQSSSSVSVYEEDSDADIMYSTDWESTSGEEDEEEEEEEEEGEEGRVIEHKPPRTKTFYIAQEILTTERTYVKGLKLIDRDFRSTILSANRAHDKPFLSEDTLKLILGNVSSILTLNAGMLAELEERMKMWDSDPRIGDIILNRAPYLKIYSEYISRFDKALKTLEETTKKNPHFARVLREFEAQPSCAQLPLAGYMLETVQRIPRYKLLLTDYVKHLPENSPDRTPSEKALDIISSVATHVNETIRQMDNFRKVMEVRKKLIGDSGDTLITPYRKLIKEGMLLKFSRKEPQPRMFFLFNDILIYSSSIPPTNTTYKVIKRIPLEGMRVEMLNDPDMRHGFQIISTCKSFRLEASSNEELHQWMSAFDTAIKEHREKAQSRRSFREQLQPDGGEESERIPLGHLAPPWLPDSAVSMCQLCSVQFTVTRRRHHCRACGQIFCSDCSGYLAPLRYKSDKLGRVCQSCYEGINGETATTDDKSLKRGMAGRPGKYLKINLPSVLKEVKARDQNAQIGGYLLSHATRSRRWKKKWFIVYNLVLYEFEKHEDVTAKSSVALPSYQIDTTYQQDQQHVFCLKHPGTGKLYFKTDTEEQRDRWLEVLEKAVRGEIGSQAPHTPIRASSPQPDDASP